MSSTGRNTARLFYRLVSAGISPIVGASAQQRLAIVNYHRVLPDTDLMRPNSPTRAVFQWQMQLLADCMNVLPLDEALQLQARGELPHRAVAITFDDGYADNADIAYPVLKELGLSATIFVATAFSTGGIMWNDAIIEFFRDADPGIYTVNGSDYRLGDAPDERRATIAALIRDIKHLPQAERQQLVNQLVAGHVSDLSPLMMNADQLRSLDPACITLGAHTVNHPILESIDDEQAAFEIRQSKQTIEQITGRPVTLFAYPNGVPGTDFSQRHVQLLKQSGFSAAVTTQRGVAGTNCDRYLLPRFTPWDKTPLRFLIRLLENYRRAI